MFTPESRQLFQSSKFQTSFNVGPFFTLLKSSLTSPKASHLAEDQATLLEVLQKDYPKHIELVEEWWNQQTEVVKANMDSQANAAKMSDGSDRILLEIAAQHPLVQGEFPGEEFVIRIERGIELFRELTEQGHRVEIYVPGSRHQQGERVDRISLAEAGRRYLLSRGLLQSDIHGEDWNDRFKGKFINRKEAIESGLGVYCSADECFVLSQAFFEENFSRAIVILSKNQLERKKLHYQAFGVLPEIIGVEPKAPFHNAEFERNVVVPFVRYIDPFVQGPNSTLARIYREVRVPGSGINC